jgi:hypothetical protein
MDNARRRMDMKKLLAAGAVAALVLLGGAMPANADPAEGQICPAGDSGKIDVTGDAKYVKVYAPEGMVITAYCVKAGRYAEIVTLDYPVNHLYIKHSSYKDVSHYSVWYEEKCW